MTQPTTKKREDLKVTIGNALIEANYLSNDPKDIPKKFTARAHKVARLIIALVKPGDTDLDFYTLSIDMLKHYLGYKKGSKWGRFLTDLDDIALRLNRHPIHIPTQNGYTKAVFIASYTIDLVERTIEFEISKKLKPYLIQLKGEFTSYLLSNIPRLKSGYSIRMYELLSQYRRIGKRHFKVDDLKLKLGCDYTLYGHFKKKALLKAQEDMSAYTDLRFEMEEHKTGRKVTALTFFIFSNTPQDSPNDSPQLSIFNSVALHDELPLVVNQLVELGIPVDTARRFFQKGFALIEDDDKRRKAQQRIETVPLYFEEKLLLLRQKQHSGTVISSTGFVIRALKEDWTDKAISVQMKGKQVSHKEREQERKIDNRNREAAKIRTEICQTIIEESPDILDLVYENAILKMGEIGQGLAKMKTPLELFQEGGFVATFMEAEFETLYPERFKKKNISPSKGDN